MHSEDFAIPPCMAGAVLFARDMDRLASFYAGALDFTEAARGDDHVVLRRDGFELTVHAIPPAFAGRGGQSSPSNRRVAAAIKPVFVVAELAALRMRIADLGGGLDSPEREWSGQGARIVDGGDPEGNVFQLRQYGNREPPRYAGVARIEYAAPVFGVADLGRALAYYRERLGFAVEFVHGDFYASVERDGCRIHLRCMPGMTPDRAVADAAECVDACFGVHDAGSLAADFIGSGADFALPLREMPYGREFYLRDPDGYVLAFVERARNA